MGEHTGICAPRQSLHFTNEETEAQGGHAASPGSQGHSPAPPGPAQESPGPPSSPVTTQHSPLRGCHYGDPHPQEFSHCPNLSPATPLSPYGHVSVAEQVSQFGVLKTGSPAAKVPSTRRAWGHRLHDGSQLPPKPSKLESSGVAWKQSHHRVPGMKPTWVLGAQLSGGMPQPSGLLR